MNLVNGDGYARLLTGTVHASLPRQRRTLDLEW